MSIFDALLNSMSDDERAALEEAADGAPITHLSPNFVIRFLEEYRGRLSSQEES